MLVIMTTVNLTPSLGFASKKTATAGAKRRMQADGLNVVDYKWRELEGNYEEIYQGPDWVDRHELWLRNTVRVARNATADEQPARGNCTQNVRQVPQFVTRTPQIHSSARRPIEKTSSTGSML